MYCKNCGKKFITRYQKKYCSRICSNKRSLTGIFRVCIKCGKKYYLCKSQIKKNIGYCSANCNRSLKVKIGKCPICYKKVIYKSRRDFETKKCCSKKCAIEKTKRTIKVICIICGKIIYRQKSKANRAKNPVCSKKCYSKSITGEKSPNWNGGCNGYRGENWFSQRNKARKRDDYTCKNCGVKEKKIKKQLDVHHIKPYRFFNGNFKEANKIENLICYCHKCHLNIERKLK